MRKFFLLSAILFMAITATAQKHEISISYGIPTSMDVENSLANGFIGVSGLDLDESFSGSFNLEYMYRLNEKIAVGAIVSYEHASIKSVDFKEDFISVLPAFKMNWVNKELFRFYSKVAAGVTIDKASIEVNSQKESDTDLKFGYQVSPIGLEVGKELNGFLELGYGVQGIANIGVRFKF
ncbi:MAG: outer membrane beta-barrel protein [Phocaeicola sp.]